MKGLTFQLTEFTSRSVQDGVLAIIGLLRSDRMNLITLQISVASVFSLTRYGHKLEASIDSAANESHVNVISQVKRRS